MERCSSSGRDRSRISRLQRLVPARSSQTHRPDAQDDQRDLQWKSTDYSLDGPCLREGFSKTRALLAQLAAPVRRGGSPPPRTSQDFVMEGMGGEFST